VLENGVAATGLEAITGSDVVYTMEVPAGATKISFSMSGGSGDADMYVKFGSAPTDSSYDCRPFENGNTESCTVTQTAGTYHVRIKAYSGFSGVSLTGSYTADSGNGGIVQPVNETINDVSVSRRSWTRYTFDLAEGYADLNVAISGGTGDADLYVTQGRQSTSSSYDCRPFENGNSESCAFTTPTAGKWYIDIYGYSAASGMTLKLEATPK
jgi:serine protease